VLQAIAAPTVQEWGTGVDGLQAALDLEKQVNQVRKIRIFCLYSRLCIVCSLYQK